MHRVRIRGLHGWRRGSAFVVRRHRMSVGYTKRRTCGVYISDMKTKIILIVSMVASLAVGFMAGHFQAANSWKHKLYDGFYTQSGGEAFVCAQALKDLRGGDTDAGFTLLEQHLDMCLAHVEPLPTQERDGAVAAGIRKARDYRLEHPWNGSPPVIEEAAERVLASAK